MLVVVPTRRLACPPPPLPALRSGDEFQKSGSGTPGAGLEKKIISDPEPDAPPGLMCVYRKTRPHAAITLGYDLVLPALITALGCVFSVRRGGGGGLAGRRWRATRLTHACRMMALSLLQRLPASHCRLPPPQVTTLILLFKPA